jgi:hypothetical protein
MILCFKRFPENSLWIAAAPFFRRSIRLKFLALWAIVAALLPQPSSVCEAETGNGLSNICTLVDAVPATNVTPTTTRYGLFNWLDHNSLYGDGVYPEPFLADDSDEEVNEFRVDWFHTERHGSTSDIVTGEIEHGFGVVTAEIEVPWERDTSRDIDPVTGISTRSREEGMGNVDLGLRSPVYQYVSSDGNFDATVGVAFELGIPTNSPVSKNTELVPKIFNDTIIANHFTIQTILGYSWLLGSGDDGGVDTFEYGIDFGYTIDHHTLPVPFVDSIIPMFELSGGTQTNKGEGGRDSLLGLIGTRLNLKAIGRFQPRLGLGYVFPIDQGAREDVHWGIVTSLVFEF